MRRQTDFFQYIKQAQAAKRSRRLRASVYKLRRHLRTWLRAWHGHLRARLRRSLASDVQYIHGADTLPPPLTPEQEADTLSRMAAGAAAGDASARDTARDTLITHNLRLVVYIARKFESSGVGIEDLISIGAIGLLKAVDTFCPDRGIKLATYSSRCIENEILMYLRKNAGGRADISIDEPLNVDWDGNELLLSDILGSEPDAVSADVEQEAERDLLKACVARLSEREQLIMHLRFGFAGQREHTQKEVADLLGISQSYISRLEKKIIKRLKQELEMAAS